MGLREEIGGQATTEVLSVSGCPPPMTVYSGGGVLPRRSQPITGWPKQNKKKRRRRKEKEKKEKEGRRKLRGRRDQGNQSKLKPPISAKITVHCDQ